MTVEPSSTDLLPAVADEGRSSAVEPNFAVALRWHALLVVGFVHPDAESVVVAGLEDFDFVVAYSVHQPMFVVDPAGPVPDSSP